MNIVLTLNPNPKPRLLIVLQPVYLLQLHTCILTRQTSIGQEQKDAIPPETAPMRIRSSTSCAPFIPVISGTMHTYQNADRKRKVEKGART